MNSSLATVVLLSAVAVGALVDARKRAATPNCAAIAPSLTKSALRVGDICFIHPNPATPGYSQTWSQAQASCGAIRYNGYQGELPVIKGQATLNALLAWLPGAYGNPTAFGNGYDWWAGGEQEWDWIKADGSGEEIQPPAPWAPNQPAANPSPLCVTIGMESNVFGLYNYPCNQPRAWFCQVYAP